jgi:hypothetical protein
MVMMVCLFMFRVMANGKLTFGFNKTAISKKHKGKRTMRLPLCSLTVISKG